MKISEGQKMSKSLSDRILSFKVEEMLCEYFAVSGKAVKEIIEEDS